MKIIDKWLEIKEEVISLVEKEESILGIKNIIIETFEKLQYAVMGDEKNLRLRQEIGLLFVNTKGSLEVLNIIGDVSIWTQEKQDKKSKEILWSVLYMILNTALVVLLLRNFYLNIRVEGYGNLLWIILVICIYTGIMAISYKLYKVQLKKTRLSHKGEINIDKEKVMTYLNLVVETLDRYIEELKILNKEESEISSGLNREILSVFQTLYEGISLDNEALIKGLERSITNILGENGIEKLEYSKENEKYFDVLPSKTMEVTIKPSFVKKEDKEIILRGMATKKI